MADQFDVVILGGGTGGYSCALRAASLGLTVALVEKAGGVADAEEALLRSLNETMAQTSICGLGQVALGPLLSVLSRFPDQIRRPKGS